MACNCSSGGKSSCQCSFMAGLNVRTFGYGTDREPFRVTVAEAFLEGLDTASAEVRITGNGDTSSPYMLSVRALGLDSKWGRWVGTQADFDAIQAPSSDTIHVVMP